MRIRRIEQSSTTEPRGNGWVVEVPDRVTTNFTKFVGKISRPPLDSSLDASIQARVNAGKIEVGNLGRYVGFLSFIDILTALTMRWAFRSHEKVLARSHLLLAAIAQSSVLW